MMRRKILFDQVPQFDEFTAVLHKLRCKLVR